MIVSTTRVQPNMALDMKQFCIHSKQFVSIIYISASDLNLKTTRHSVSKTSQSTHVFPLHFTRKSFKDVCLFVETLTPAFRSENDEVSLRSNFVHIYCMHFIIITLLCLQTILLYLDNNFRNNVKEFTSLQALH